MRCRFTTPGPPGWWGNMTNENPDGIGGFGIGASAIGGGGDPDLASPKQGAGRWRKGESGNPAGRAPGSRNKALAALDAIGEAGAEAVLRRTVEAAQGGDMRAAEVILSRLWPARKGRPVALAGMPRIETPGDLVRALGAVADAVAGGSITPEEGQAVASVLEAQRRAVETADLAERVAALEAKENKR